MILLLILVGAAIALSHTAPFPFLLEYLGPGRSVWHMPASDGQPRIYLTFDDGPNPTATPALLDVLERENVPVTFFLIPAHITDETAPIVRRIVRQGHALAQHSSTRALMLLPPADLAARLEADRRRIAEAAEVAPCRLFRPHASWRGGQMYAGLERADYRLAGWSFGMWDWNWWRPVQPGGLAERLAGRASDQLIPMLRQRGFAFARLCEPLSPFASVR